MGLLVQLKAASAVVARAVQRASAARQQSWVGWWLAEPRVVVAAAGWQPLFPAAPPGMEAFRRPGQPVASCGSRRGKQSLHRCLPLSGRQKAERCERFTPWPSAMEGASGIKSQLQWSFQPILLWSNTFFLLFLVLICKRMVEQMQVKTLRITADGICFPGRTGSSGAPGLAQRACVCTKTLCGLG